MANLNVSRKFNMTTRNRHAGTGRFISDEKAKKLNPDKWIKETISKSTKKPKK